MLAGRITVNGRPLTELGSKVDPDVDHIKVDGRRLRFDHQKVYLLLNKPKGYLSTLSDPEGRPKVTDLINGSEKKVFPVGRLDYHTEGLLLLTNDGEFANCVSKAGKHCPKTYLVKVKGNPDPKTLKVLSEGILVDGRKLAPCVIRPSKEGNNPWFNVTLTEGRNNQIRKMFERMGHPVLKLRRIQIGLLRNSDLRPGQYRRLTRKEVDQVMRQVKRSEEQEAQSKGSRKF